MEILISFCTRMASWLTELSRASPVGERGGEEAGKPILDKVRGATAPLFCITKLFSSNHSLAWWGSCYFSQWWERPDEVQVNR